MNIDTEIYVKKVIDFFEKNPDSLTELIGSLNKERFYEEIKNVANKNFEDKNDAELTKKQLIEIVTTLSGAIPKKLDVRYIQQTPIGTFFLN